MRFFLICIVTVLAIALLMLFATLVGKSSVFAISSVVLLLCYIINEKYKGYKQGKKLLEDIGMGKRDDCEKTDI